MSIRCPVIARRAASAKLTAAFLAVIVAAAADTARAQSVKPYDAMRDMYGKFLDPDDPLGFPLKVKSLKKDPYTFWRGGKDLFFRWCKQSGAVDDWLNSPADGWVVTHGDLHI